MRSYVQLLAIVVLSFTSSAALARNTNAIINSPPPRPIYEVNPGERPGHILTPGYWNWDGARHVWQTSRWIEKREGYVWFPDQWEQRGNKWQLAAGRWEEDESYEAVEEIDEKPAPQKSLKKKRIRKPIDYNDTRKWPRVIRR